jgi:hypothetical protein
VRAPPRTGVPAPPRTGVPATARIGAEVSPGIAVPMPLLTAVPAPLLTAVPAPPTAVPAVRVPVRPLTAGGSHRLAGVHPRSRARVRSAGVPEALPTADRAGTAGHPRSAAARPDALVTSHDGQVHLGQAAPAVSAPPAGPARKANPAGRPGPRRVTGRGGPLPAETRVATPGPEAVRAGPPMVTVHVAGVHSAPVTADPRQRADLAVRASLAPRVPPAAATRAQVPQGRARTARVGTTPTGAHPGRVVSDPVPMARRIGPLVVEATPPGGRLVTGQQDPRATEPATVRRGRPAPAAATAPGAMSTIGAMTTAGATAGSARPAGAPRAATALGAVTAQEAVAAPGAATEPMTVNEPGAATAAGAVTALEAAAAPGAATGPGAMSVPGAAAGSARAPGAPGPGGTRRRPGRRASPGRSFRTRSLPSNWIPRRGPS